jgi:hypothetical protein
MEKKYSSELARRISTGTGRASTFGLKFLAMAISVCAVLSVAAAAVLGVVATKPATAGPDILYTNVMDETDYLIYDVTSTDIDGNALTAVVGHSDEPTDIFAVKREMTLKQGDWTAPGNPAMQWKKVVYTVNLRLRDLVYTDPINGDLASVQPIGMIAGVLDLGYGTEVLSVVSESFTVNGCVPAIYDSLGNVIEKADAVSASLDETGRLWVTVQLPALDGFSVGSYSEGDAIAVSVILKAPFSADAVLDPSESAFPEFDDVAIEAVIA